MVKGLFCGAKTSWHKASRMVRAKFPPCAVGFWVVLMLDEVHKADTAALLQYDANA